MKLYYSRKSEANDAGGNRICTFIDGLLEQFIWFIADRISTEYSTLMK